MAPISVTDINLHAASLIDINWNAIDNITHHLQGEWA